MGVGGDKWGKLRSLIARSPIGKFFRQTEDVANQLRTIEQQTGARLRLTCATRGWSLARFAKRAAISRSALYRFLEGHEVKAPTAIAISRASFEMMNESVELPRVSRFATK